MKTTLNKIREHDPCTEGWKKLLKHLGKKQADDAPLAITTILASNGLADALWCLRAVEGHDREILLYAVCCARQVQHLMTDERSLTALDVAEAYANGNATKAELDAAWAEGAAAARDAAWAAAWAAGAAAGAAARDAAGAAAWAAGAAAWAAGAAAGAAGAAGSAARDAQAQKLREICTEIEGTK